MSPARHRRIRYAPLPLGMAQRASGGSASAKKDQGASFWSKYPGVNWPYGQEGQAPLTGSEAG